MEKKASFRVLVVGGGGREHAICWKLAQSPAVEKLYCAPGNAGIETVATCIPVSAEDLDGIVRTAGEHEIDLAVIGPEVPLAMGITDRLQEAIPGIKVFGPNAKCAKLEASKAFTKEFLKRHQIPTAAYREYTDAEALTADIGIFGYPMVLKADGLAAGKGVVLAENEEEAKAAIDDMMQARKFGEAGDKVVVEECLTGVEASVLCFVDGKTIVPMESAQDYKRIGDGDAGPNTGGMGTYSPSLVFTPELEEQIRDRILASTLSGFQEDGLDFHGVLFIGLMITEEGPKVIEFNNRFGDPEAQSVLMRMDSDLFEIMLAVCEDRLAEAEIRWKEERAVCVVCASGGYPGSYEKGKIIHGLEKVEEDVVVFHAGTTWQRICGDDGCARDVVTAGGRVLGVTALGSTHEEARTKAYENVKKISFEGMTYRKDIGVVKGR